jgi:Rieske Fe-S protein
MSRVEDPYVTRREFTKSLVLVSCAAFCANGALAAMAALEDVRSQAKTEPKKIGRVHELPIGGSRVFEYPVPGEPCRLVRLDADRFVAFGQKCTVEGCPVIFRQEERQFQCPRHEGYFSAENGKVIAGPPPRPLPRIDLERKGDELWAVAIQK